MVLNCEIHKKVFIHVYLQFKSEFKENYLALTSLKIPLNLWYVLSVKYKYHCLETYPNYSEDKETDTSESDLSTVTLEYTLEYSIGWMHASSSIATGSISNRNEEYISCSIVPRSTIQIYRF